MPKDENAIARGRKRWEGLSAAERSAIMAPGQLGGAVTIIERNAELLTAEQRERLQLIVCGKG